jgi:hypothetical protein
VLLLQRHAWRKRSPMLRTLARASLTAFPQITTRMASSQPDLTAAAPTPAGPKTENEKPWHAAFPTPTRSLDDGSLSTVTAQELREWMTRRKSLEEEKDYLVVDVRRTDFEVSSNAGGFQLFRRRYSSGCLPSGDSQN